MNRSEPLDAIPPLAGVTTHAAAARVGLSVEENVRRLLRYHWVERRLMGIALARLAGTPEWEVKGAFSLHQWQDAEHTEALRRRIHEMRHPVPRLDVAPDPALEAALAELEAAPGTVELLAAIYGALRPALATAYRRHMAETNPLVDHPTRRILRFALLEEEEAISWGRAALAALAARGAQTAARAADWERHVQGWLQAAGGVDGLPPDGRDRARGADPPPENRVATSPAPPVSRVAAAPAPSFQPRRDARFRGSYNFVFPPHALARMAHIPADERNLALLCKRLLEMDVPEMMASFLSEERDRPWQFQLDYARQLWDEARHSMMGEVALEARGVDWRRIPLNVGFSLRLNLHADPLEREILLFAIEQSLMPAETGKRSERDTAEAAGDALSAHFHDYDWADEVLHTQIGRRWLRDAGISPAEAAERAAAIHARTWVALDGYRDREEQSAAWWDALVRAVLGRPTAARAQELEDPSVVAE